MNVFALIRIDPDRVSQYTGRKPSSFWRKDPAWSNRYRFSSSIVKNTAKNSFSATSEEGRKGSTNV